MKQRTVKAWFSEPVVKDMLVEAERLFPLEAGGALMGYWSEAKDEVVICHVTGPGPRAVYLEHSFIPDYDYQDMKIARLYEQSGRVHTYLGDWHTHPREAVYLSPKDKCVLRKVAGFPEARAPVPIMAILGGGDPEWLIGAWRYVPRGEMKFIRKGNIFSLEINFY